MTRNRIDAAEADIDALVTDKLGGKTGGILRKLHKGAAYLPRGAGKAVSEDLTYLETARKRTAHPRRRGQLDRKRVEQMVRKHEQRFSKVDVARDKARDRLNWLGILVINLMIFGVVYYALLTWLGAI